MNWFRVDSRLVHGQVIEAWIPYLHVQTLVVINDQLALDRLQQEVMRLAIPDSINVFYTPVSHALSVYTQTQKKSSSSLFLLSCCTDAQRVKEQGVPLTVLNIGNIHYAPGKKQLSPNIAVSPEEKSCLQTMEASGVTLDFRAVPGDPLITGLWHD